MAKYVFITGGVVSGLGKGITASSLGMLLKNSGLNVQMQKFDPYLNVDPGTMSPYQHGEVYVTYDGGETDLDLGHYERFINVNLTKKSSVSSGKIYLEVLEGERRGIWGGSTIQVIPHITNQIKNRIYAADKDPNIDVMIIEIGGTVGDIEAQAFLEALRQVRLDKGRENVLFLHVGLIPFIKASKEYKTKPFQHSVKELLSLGVQPDILVTRSEGSIGKEIKEKLALFCNVPVNNVIEAIDIDTIYKIPQKMGKQNLHILVMEQLKINIKPTIIDSWNKFVKNIELSKEEVEISIVGKYVEMPDAYLSVIESLKIAAWHLNRNVKIRWIKSDELTEDNYKNIFENSKGILIPGGFGYRGVEGMILAVRYARENKIPYLGICLGMQVSIIEIARNVLKLKDSNSTEFDEKTTNPVIDIIRGKDKNNDLGGTLRLGEMLTTLSANTLAHKLYQNLEINERHRHRYEFNNSYRQQFEKETNIIFSGIYKEKNLIEIIELKDHPFFIATQFHPEFTSRPTNPNPLFNGFIEAIIKNSN